MASLSEDLLYSLDPVAYAETLDLGFKLDGKQKEYLRFVGDRLIVNCTRQWGKTTLTGIRAIHKAEFTPKSLTVVTSPSLRQSKMLFSKITEFRKTRGVPLVVDNSLEFKTESGSWVVCCPANPDTIRGFSGVDLLIMDEGAFAPDALYHAIKPMLAVSRGQLILPSTPHGKKGVFYNEWTGGEGWERMMVTAEQCGHIDKEWLAKEKRSIPEFYYRQEYCCEFVETEDSFFSYDHIHNALTDDDTELLF